MFSGLYIFHMESPQMVEEWEEAFQCCASFILRLRLSKHICTFPSLMDRCNYDAERILFSLKISCTLCQLPSK